MPIKFEEKIRIIPKLEIKNQYLIKGVRFEGLRKLGDPVKFAEEYYNNGADQINIIDIVASLYSRENLYEVVNKITEKVYIPICVGGGIKKIEHIQSLLKCGADRIIINSEALRRENFINEVVNIFGGQFISVSIEAKKINNKYYCMMDHGRENSNKTVSEWLNQLNKFPIGEIILNSIDNDGMENGFNEEIIKLLFESNISCSKVVCGGAGKEKDFLNILKKYKVEGVSAATSFHFSKINILKLKNFLFKNKLNINLL